jgi:hypothetical protein
MICSSSAVQHAAQFASAPGRIPRNTAFSTGHRSISAAQLSGFPGHLSRSPGQLSHSPAPFPISLATVRFPPGICPFPPEILGVPPAIWTRRTPSKWLVSSNLLGFILSQPVKH